MKGMIYIAGTFETVQRGGCGRGKGWIDNDPHFWTLPPTWGICRNDLRRKAEPGDLVFFVLPAKAKHPQCIFGYLKIKEIISHYQAWHRPDLQSKRMGNKNPNGNIIVTGSGAYNRYDAGAHRQKFERIKERYAVGDPDCSRLLSASEIRRLAPDFVNVLSVVMGRSGFRPIDFISRAGSFLDGEQVSQLLAWINGASYRLST
jgi:hypothetical protein